MRTHLFPSRTQKLSAHTPTILGWRRPGKIGSCRDPRRHSFECLFFCAQSAQRYAFLPACTIFRTGAICLRYDKSCGTQGMQIISYDRSRSYIAFTQGNISCGVSRNSRRCQFMSSAPFMRGTAIHSEESAVAHAAKLCYNNTK